MDARFVVVALVLIMFLFRPPLGYDTYYFFTDNFRAPPLAKLFFSFLPMWAAPIVAYVLTLITIYIMHRVGKVSPLLILAVPYLFGYTFRLEDDQLAYPFLVLSAMLYLRGRKLEGLLATLPALFIWRGAFLYLAAYLLSLANISRIISFVAGLSIGATFINPAVAEQSPVFALLFMPIIYIALVKNPHKMDNLTAMMLGIGLLFPKWLWTVLPMLYYYAMTWWNSRTIWERAGYVLAGVFATILIVALAFPHPWMSPEKICPHQKESEWALGWWCRSHGYDVPFAGSPPGSNVILTTS